MSDDAKVILLLCGRLGKDSDAEPLQQSEYTRVVRWLLNNGMRPSDLLNPANVAPAAVGTRLLEPRLALLLKRGVQLGFAVETWSRSNIWVICRSDADYPARYRTHLKDQAPPILYGVGNHNEGGTWAGATEELKRKPGRPVFVRMAGTAPVGNRKLLDLGAVPFPDHTHNCPEGLWHLGAGRAGGLTQPPRSTSIDHECGRCLAT